MKNYINHNETSSVIKGTKSSYHRRKKVNNKHIENYINKTNRVQPTIC